MICLLQNADFNNDTRFLIRFPVLSIKLEMEMKKAEETTNRRKEDKYGVRYDEGIVGSRCSFRASD